MALVAGSTLNPLGSITYNGFEFKGPRFSWSAAMRPEWSKDGRTTLGSVTTLTVRYMLSDGYNIDDLYHSNNVDVTANHNTNILNGRRSIQWLRTMLLKSGCRLTIEGMGFDIDLNPGQGSASVTGSFDQLIDIRWGPKPINCEITPIGDGIFWQIDWVVEYCLPECTATSGNGHTGYTAQDGGVSSYVGYPYLINMAVPFDANYAFESVVYNVGWTIDRAGLTTRVIEGELSVITHRKSAATLNGARNEIPWTADEAREIIAPVVPDEFQRIDQNWELSEDKRSLSFRIIDQELASENAMPPGVVDMQLSHSVSTQGLGLPGNTSIICSFNGYVEIVKGFSKGFVFDRCLLIIQQRIDQAKIAYNEVDAAGNVTKNVYLTSISVTEEMYGTRRISFTVGYMIMQPNASIKFQNLISNTALFEEVDLDSVTYPQWQKSLKNSAWHQRGMSRMEFQANEDKIVGPCEGQGGSNRTTLTLPLYVTNGGGSLTSECPPDDLSYLGWSSSIKIIGRQGVIINEPLRLPGQSTTTYKPKSDDDATVLPVARSAGTEKRKAQLIQANTTILVELQGKGARLGKYPEIPRISADKFATDAFTQANDITPVGYDEIENSRRGRLGPCAIYVTKWKLRYHVLVTSEAELKDLLGALENATILTSEDPTGKKEGGTGNAVVTGSITGGADQFPTNES